jgi:hypothetical protein
MSNNNQNHKDQTTYLYDSICKLIKGKDINSIKFKARLFLHLELVNKTLCSIVLTETTKQRVNIYKYFEANNDKDQADDINYQNFKNNKLFDLYLGNATIILNYIKENQELSNSFINKIKYKYLLYLSLANDFFTAEGEANTTLISMMQTPKKLIKLQKDNIVYAQIQEKNNEPITKNIEENINNLIVSYCDTFNMNNFIKNISDLKNLRNWIEHPEDSAKKRATFNAIILSFFIVKDDLNENFLKNIEQFLIKQNAKSYETLNSLHKNIKKLKKAYAKYFHDDIKKLTQEQKSKDKSQKKQDIQHRENRQKRKQLLLGEDTKQAGDKTKQVWKQAYEEYKKDYAYNSKILNQLNFKGLYYFMGQHNIKEIKAYLNTYFEGSKIRFLELYKFYLAMLNIAGVFRYYIYILQITEPNLIEQSEELKNLRDNLAHNNLWFSKYNPNDVENKYNPFCIIKKVLIDMQNKQKDLKCDDYRHILSDFVNQANAIIDKLKLPIIDNQIIQNSNYKKLKKQKADAKNNKKHYSGVSYFVIYAKKMKKDLYISLDMV